MEGGSEDEGGEGEVVDMLAVRALRERERRVRFGRRSGRMRVCMEGLERAEEGKGGEGRGGERVCTLHDVDGVGTGAIALGGGHDAMIVADGTRLQWKASLRCCRLSRNICGAPSSLFHTV